MIQTRTFTSKRHHLIGLIPNRFRELAIIKILSRAELGEPPTYQKKIGNEDHWEFSG